MPDCTNCGPFDELNRSCFCITADTDALLAELNAAAHPHLFSRVPVFVAPEAVAEMQRVVAAVERVSSLAAYRGDALADAPDIARRGSSRGHGVFMGFDFHLSDDGPKLIEINTNAGGALLNVALGRAQQACCDMARGFAAAPMPFEQAEDTFFRMFEAEGGRPLRRVAIVDDAPETQYLYPEFVQFQRMFERRGVEAFIADPRALDLTGVDLVYNRSTDFYFASEASAVLARAYLDDSVVMTPNPRTHALFANKLRLVTLSNADRLRALGADEEAVRVLSRAVPETERVDASRADELWQRRKALFFKPLAGYGSKAAYRGDKLTRGVFEEIMAKPYVAQALVRPSERVVKAGDSALKVDVRAYAYAGRVQLMAARLYQGQTTNFRTVGGGFAPVLTAG